MPRKHKGNYKIGRPKFGINWNEVDNLLEAGCSGAEVAACLGCHADTIYDRCLSEKGVSFSEYMSQKRSRGDSILKHIQYKLALGGDRGMLIWLGKNRLGQSDDPSKKDNDYAPIDALLKHIMTSSSKNLLTLGPQNEDNKDK